ncbi:MAG: zinc-ribbon domain-containing protein [Solobacterium sp.]|nr:zinc-ribbon domain-containing protein [Solobacterium sp.]MBR2793669.1 zinc-ribbon domain-containing protein [Solobacterium sp.]
MICPSCKKEIPDGSVYCTFCGTRLREPEPGIREPVPEPVPVLKEPVSELLPVSSAPASVALSGKNRDLPDRLMLASRIMFWSGIVIGVFFALIPFSLLSFEGFVLGLLTFAVYALICWVISLILEGQAQLQRRLQNIEQVLSRSEIPDDMHTSDRKDSAS